MSQNLKRWHYGQTNFKLYWNSICVCLCCHTRRSDACAWKLKYRIIEIGCFWRRIHVLKIVSFLCPVAESLFTLSPQKTEVPSVPLFAQSLGRPLTSMQGLCKVCVCLCMCYKVWGCLCMCYKVCGYQCMLQGVCLCICYKVGVDLCMCYKVDVCACCKGGVCMLQGGCACCKVGVCLFMCCKVGVCLSMCYKVGGCLCMCHKVGGGGCMYAVCVCWCCYW